MTFEEWMEPFVDEVDDMSNFDLPCCSDCGFGNLFRASDGNYVLFCHCGEVRDMILPNAIKKFERREFEDSFGAEDAKTAQVQNW